jgi:predicted GNAT family acetyltransferase
MDIKELHSFKMSDAVKFHDKLNPNLWRNNHLDPAVRKQLIVIAEDFLSNMGISGLDVKDITVSGSSAAYSYTPHSDLDLHILVDMSKLPNDEVYRELFNAKKTIYNDSHDIKVKGVPVELYVQDSNEPVVSLGEYSILNDKWLKIPSKRRANLDQNATKAKYDKLAGLVDLALKSRNLERVKDTIKTIKRYRQAGLDKFGEFGPENLAYKAVRSQGAIDALYKLRDELHGEELSIEEMYSGPKMKFLRPGELKGSYSDYDLLRMGFKKSQNGSWYIPQVKWDKLVASQQIGEEEDLAERYAKEFEDYDPNGVPPGPEFKPTMPAGTVKVDVSDTYDWYKLGQHISNLKGLGKHDFGKGPPSTIMAFGSEPEEHKYIQDLEKTGLTTTDIDPVDPNQPKGMKRQKVDPTYNVNEALDRDSAIAQIQKLRNIAGRTPAEIDAARSIINRLAQKFNITNNDLETVTKNPYQAKIDQKSAERRAAAERVKAEYNRMKDAFTGKAKSTFSKFAEDETLQYAAEKTAATNPYGGMKDRQYRGTISEDSDILDIKFTQEPYEGWNGMGTMITAYADGDQVGQVIFEPTDNDKNKWYATEVEVEDEFQRKGIATAMYDMAKKIAQQSNAVIVPSHAQTSDAKGMWKDKKVWEASGYIPSAKEKNDPRFKTALTKDVRPDAIKKNAKAFGFKTSRAGIPPQARADGKV